MVWFSMIRNLKMSISLVLFIALSGCLNAKKINLQVNSSNILNRSDTGDSLPVRMRVYQLNSVQKFNNVRFEEIWADDIKALEDSMLTKEEFTIVPGKSRSIFINSMKDAKYIGVMAAFRDIQEKHWKYVADINQSVFSKKIQLLVKENNILEKE